MSDLQMTQAVAFVETLCDEMSQEQIEKALDRWEFICEQQGWNHPLGLEVEISQESIDEERNDRRMAERRAAQA